MDGFAVGRFLRHFVNDPIVVREGTHELGSHMQKLLLVLEAEAVEQRLR